MCPPPPLCFSGKMPQSKVVTGALIFSLGLGLGTAGWYIYNQSHKTKPALVLTVQQKSEVQGKLTEALTPDYCESTEKIIQIYNAVGLGPLLEQRLAHAPANETIPILNTLLQATILRPKHLDRYQLNDTEYLGTLQEKLTNAYHAAGLSQAPAPIDAAALRRLLLDPTLWQDETQGAALTVPPNIDTVGLFGDLYQGYFDRQSYFLELEKQQKIHLEKDASGYCSVYLLGGDRVLNPLVDGPILDLRIDGVKNEQDMMDYMFEEVLKHRAKGLTPLMSVATNSPQQQGYRPTTASTLQSFIELTHLKHLAAPKSILFVSSAPFIRYQNRVTKRIFQEEGVSALATFRVMGPGLENQLKTHAEFAKTALIANCLDTLAREMYEINRIRSYKLTHNNVPEYEAHRLCNTKHRPQ